MQAAQRKHFHPHKVWLFSFLFLCFCSIPGNGRYLLVEIDVPDTELEKKTDVSAQVPENEKNLVKKIGGISQEKLKESSRALKSGPIIMEDEQPQKEQEVPQKEQEVPQKKQELPQKEQELPPKVGKVVQLESCIASCKKGGQDDDEVSECVDTCVKAYQGGQPEPEVKPRPELRPELRSGQKLSGIELEYGDNEDIQKCKVDCQNQYVLMKWSKKKREECDDQCEEITRQKALPGNKEDATGGITTRKECDQSCHRRFFLDSVNWQKGSACHRDCVKKFPSKGDKSKKSEKGDNLQLSKKATRLGNGLTPPGKTTGAGADADAKTRATAGLRFLKGNNSPIAQGDDNNNNNDDDDDDDADENGDNDDDDAKWAGMKSFGAGSTTVPMTLKPDKVLRQGVVQGVQGVRHGPPPLGVQEEYGVQEEPEEPPQPKLRKHAFHSKKRLSRRPYAYYFRDLAQASDLNEGGDGDDDKPEPEPEPEQSKRLRNRRRYRPHRERL